MNNIKILVTLAALFVCGQSHRVFGQASVPFDCNTGGMILSQGNGTNATVFYRVNTNNNPFTFDAMFTIPYNLNSTAYNPYDNYIYAFPTGTTSTLLKIDLNGAYSVLTASVAGTAPNGGAYKGGTIDNNGIYYLAPNTSDQALFYIDLKAPNASNIYQAKRIPLASGNLNLPDIVWDKNSGKIYGVESYAGQEGKLDIISVNPTFTQATLNRIGKGDATNYQFGAMYLGSNGIIYGSLNGGGFYQFDIATGNKIKISGSPGSSTNDGANCPLAPITFGTDIKVTKTDNTDLLIPGNTTVYTIVVSNEGPFGAMNIQVSDPLPAGIPAENVSYTAIVTGSAITNVTGT
ncbi:DUF6923 family protein [Dysgonomonas sp.]